MAHKSKSQLGLFDKFFLRRRIDKLKTKLGKARDRFCDVAYAAEIEKSKAEHILTKAEYERYADDIDQHFEEACNCAGAKYRGRGDRKAAEAAGGGEPATAGPRVKGIHEKCVRGIKQAVWGDKERSSAGIIAGKGENQRFKTANPPAAILNVILDNCVAGGGKFTVPSGQMIVKDPATGAFSKTSAPTDVIAMDGLGRRVKPAKAKRGRR